MDAEQIQQLLPAAVFEIVMVGLFWFIIVRPARQRDQRHRETITGLVPGDKIVTVGGIYGSVTRVGEDTFELEVSKGVTVTFDRRAVRRQQDE